MSQHLCTIKECSRRSRVLCYCCAKDFCIEHLRNHNDEYLFQLYQLTDDINHLSEYIRGQYRQQLDQWCHEAHRTIDLYYEKKCQELECQTLPNEKLNQNRQVIDWMKLRITQLIREQNTTQQQIDSLKAATNAVQHDLEQIPRETYQLTICPLILNENSIRLEKSQVNFNLYSTIKSLVLTENLSTNDCIVMANNSKYFLIGQQSNLCLFDQNLTKVKEIPWRHGCIWDMCMSTILSKFILVTENGVFTLDEQTMVIEELNDLTKGNKSWYSCASSEKSLFLATQEINTTISEYVLVKNKFSLKRHQLCCSNNEYIEHIKCSKDSLGLIILNAITGQRRFEMRSITTLKQLWTISLSIHDTTNIVSCCSLNEKGWLIIDLAQTRLIHISNQGQINESVTYKSSPQYAVQFNNNILAILTEEGINLHKIE